MGEFPLAELPGDTIALGMRGDSLPPMEMPGSGDPGEHARRQVEQSLEANRAAGKVAVSSTPKDVKVDTPRHWQDQANCRGVYGTFHAPSGPETQSEKKGREARAKEICGTCVVRQACLNYALSNNEEYGVWGGMSEKDRKQIRRAWLRQRREARASG